MRLSEKKAKFLTRTTEERYSFLRFECPCGCGVYAGVSFTPALDGTAVDGHVWNRISGSTIEDITLQPSVLIHPHHQCKGWHGYVTNGELVTAP